MNGLKTLCLKRIMKIYVNSLLLSVVFIHHQKYYKNIRIQLAFWWYKNATLKSNKLKKRLKKTEKYVVKDFLCNHCLFIANGFFKLFFFFFPHLIYLPQLIVDKKRISVIFKQGQRNSKLAQKWRFFSSFQRQKVEFISYQI